VIKAFTLLNWTLAWKCLHYRLSQELHRRALAKRSILLYIESDYTTVARESIAHPNASANNE
jgi:hypothetical protein